VQFQNALPVSRPCGSETHRASKLAFWGRPLISGQSCVRQYESIICTIRSEHEMMRSAFRSFGPYIWSWHAAAQQPTSHRPLDLCGCILRAPTNQRRSRRMPRISPREVHAAQPCTNPTARPGRQWVISLSLGESQPTGHKCCVQQPGRG
jgi:hypothetical protein